MAVQQVLIPCLSVKCQHTITVSPYDQFGGQQIQFTAQQNTSNNGDETTNVLFTTTLGGNAGHSHTISPSDNRPAFATVLLCQKE